MKINNINLCFILLNFLFVTNTKGLQMNNNNGYCKIPSNNINDTNNKQKASDSSSKTLNDTNKVNNSSVDTPPSYPGGDAALNDFLENNLLFPKGFKKKGSFICYIFFVVDIDGKVIDVKIKQSTGYDELDNEALRVVKKIPKFTPALFNSVKVKAPCIIPITFEN